MQVSYFQENEFSSKFEAIQLNLHQTNTVPNFIQPQFEIIADSRIESHPTTWIPTTMREFEEGNHDSESLSSSTSERLNEVKSIRKNWRPRRVREFKNLTYLPLTSGVDLTIQSTPQWNGTIGEFKQINPAKKHCSEEPYPHPKQNKTNHRKASSIQNRDLSIPLEPAQQRELHLEMIQKSHLKIKSYLDNIKFFENDLRSSLKTLNEKNRKPTYTVTIPNWTRFFTNLTNCFMEIDHQKQINSYYYRKIYENFDQMLAQSKGCTYYEAEIFLSVSPDKLFTKQESSRFLPMDRWKFRQLLQKKDINKTHDEFRSIFEKCFKITQLTLKFIQQNQPVDLEELNFLVTGSDVDVSSDSPETTKQDKQQDSGSGVQLNAQRFPKIAKIEVFNKSVEKILFYCETLMNNEKYLKKFEITTDVWKQYFQHLREKHFNCTQKHIFILNFKKRTTYDHFKDIKKVSLYDAHIFLFPQMSYTPEESAGTFYEIRKKIKKFVFDKKNTKPEDYLIKVYKTCFKINQLTISYIKNENQSDLDELKCLFEKKIVS